MKYLFFFLICVGAAAQQKPFKPLTACDCADLNLSGRGYFGSEKSADSLVNVLILKIAKLSKLNIADNIQVKEAACPSPMALICNTKLPNGKTKEVRVILYNNFFLDNITKKDAQATWVDKHILAHEIGHHVFGDPVNAESIATLRKMYEFEQGISTQKAKKQAINNIQAQEIQADFFALWLLSKTEPRFNFKELAQGFDTLEIFQTEKKSGQKATSTHPLFSERLKAMRLFWTKLEGDRQKTVSVGRRYFADAATAAYIDLRPEKAFWDVSLGAGITVFGLPTFKLQNERVDGFLYSLPDAYNTNFNLLVSRLNWQKPLRFEFEMGWTRQKYGTTSESTAGKRLVEQMQTSYATFGPRLTWSSVGRTQGLFTGKVGFFGSFGANLRYPLAFSYVNYALPLSNTPAFSLQPSASPRVVLGVEYLKKSLLPRGFKVALGYEWQQTTFNTTPKARISSHNFDCTIYYSVFRR